MDSSQRRFAVTATVIAAFIGAVAVVAAAWVASDRTASATTEAIRAENERNAARLDSEARGAARVLASEFFLAAKEMGDLALDGYFRPFDETYRIEIPQEDLRLVASRLSREQWTAIYLAMSSVQGLERYVRIRARPDNPLSRRPLSRHTLTLVGSDMEFVGEAIGALSGLAQLEDARHPTLDVEAAYRRLRP